MNELPVAYVIGIDHTRHHMLSGRPDAPVVIERHRVPGASRAALAARLHALADRMNASAARAQRNRRSTTVAGC